MYTTKDNDGSYTFQYITSSSITSDITSSRLNNCMNARGCSSTTSFLTVCLENQGNLDHIPIEGAYLL